MLIAVTSYGPEEIFLDRLEINSEAPFWIKGKGFSEQTCIFVGKYKLNTILQDSDGTIAANIPYNLLRYGDDFAIKIIDYKSNQKLELCNLIVKKIKLTILERLKYKLLSKRDEIILDTNSREGVHTQIKPSTITTKNTIEIVNWGPASIDLDNSIVGSNLWCEAIGGSKYSKIYIDNIPIHTYIDVEKNRYVANFPEWIKTKNDKIKVFMKDESTGITSGDIFIYLKNPNKKNTDKIDSLLERLHPLEEKESFRKFEGWGMATDHEPPWLINSLNSQRFHKVSKKINEDYELTAENLIDKASLYTLNWRHWNVQFAARLAIKNCNLKNGENIAFIECGVQDGITSSYALEEIADSNKKLNIKFHLYDAWEPMKGEYLLDNEKNMIDHYKEISISRTQKNLTRFADITTFHQGFLPDTLVGSLKDDSKIIFLHFDLNSLMPTMKSLEFFMPMMEAGSVILFDDYGWVGYEDTRESLNTFFAKYDGELLVFPTGQALYLL